jgi:hypothetical protein
MPHVQCRFDACRLLEQRRHAIVTMRQDAISLVVRISTARIKGHLLAQPRKSVVTLWLLQANRAHVVHKTTTSATAGPDLSSGSGAGSSAGRVTCLEYSMYGRLRGAFLATVSADGALERDWGSSAQWLPALS